MIDTPEITTSLAQLMAFIHLTVPRAEIRNVMGPGLQELHKELAAQGIKPTGPWFTRHLKMDPGMFDFEICLPVDSPAKPSGRMKPGELLARKVARTVYRGPYQGLGAGWGEFEAWITANGHKTAADLWEVYRVGPVSGAKPGDWQTELNRPLIG